MNKLDPGLTASEAREDVLALTAWHPLEPTLGLIESAWDIQDRWGFSFWNSRIVAAARAQGCEILLTEDLAHDQRVDGLRVVNPFEEAPEAVLG